MQIIIVGYGRVGIRTAHLLKSEGHEVIIVDNDPEKVKRAAHDGFDVIEGEGSQESTLEEAGVESADALAGLTGDLNVNYTACMIGRHHGCRTVLRIDEDYRREIYDKYADEVDEIVYPERLGAAGAKTALLGGDFNVISDLTEELSLSVVTIGADAPVVGKHVNDLSFEGDARIYAHGRESTELTIPLPGTIIQAGDRVAVISDQGELESVRNQLIGEKPTA